MLYRYERVRTPNGITNYNYHNGRTWSESFGLSPFFIFTMLNESSEKLSILMIVMMSGAEESHPEGNEPVWLAADTEIKNK